MSIKFNSFAVKYKVKERAGCKKCEERIGEGKWGGGGGVAHTQLLKMQIVLQTKNP